MPDISSILRFLQPLAAQADNRYIDGTRNAVQRHMVPGVGNPGIAFGGVPRPKFLFGVRFFSSHFDGKAGHRGYNKQGTALSFMVKYIDKPKINFNTEVLNQYNKQRLVHTKIDYQPVTLRFHDAVDDRVLTFFHNYFSFYFGDARKSDPGDWDNDIVRPDFYDDGNGWGFNPKGSGGFENFFSHMEILQFYGGYYNLLTLVRPKVETFDHDNNDHEQGTTGSEINMSLRFEGVIHDSGGKKITSDMADEFELGSFANLLDIPGTIDPNFDLGTFGDIINTDKIFSDVLGAGKTVLGDLGNNFPDFNATTSLPQEEKTLQRGSSTSVFGNMNFGSSTMSGRAVTELSNSLASSVAGSFNTSAKASLSTLPVSTGMSSTVFNQALSEVSKNSTSVISNVLAGAITTVAATTGTAVGDLITSNDGGMNLPSAAMGSLNDSKPPSAQQGIAESWSTVEKSIQKNNSAETVET